MKLKHFLLIAIFITAGTVLLIGAESRAMQGSTFKASPRSSTGTGFTYQGYLEENGNPADDTYDFQCSLYNAEEGGDPIGSTIMKEDIIVDEGLFDVILDFGSVFDGTAMWLEIAVRPGDSSESFTFLSPRTPISPTPYALYSLNTAAHDHFGDSWSGVLTEEHGIAIVNEASTGYSAGIYGASLSETGKGVLGSADATSGGNTGVYGRTYSTGGVGVYGMASAVTGTNIGVVGVSDSTEGKGIHGLVNATSGDTIGVYGLTHSTAGKGVQGKAAADSGENYGIFGSSSSPDGYGGYFYNTAEGTSLYSGGVTEIEGTLYHDGMLTPPGAPYNRALPPSDNSITVIDSHNVGIDNDITIGSDGLPIISYHDPKFGALKVAHCNDLECTNATITRVDSESSLVGTYTSIAIGSDGFPIISYYSEATHDLKVAHCNSLDCTNHSITAADTFGDVGKGSSITIGSDGLPIISYRDFDNNQVKVVHCDNLDCTIKTRNVLPFDNGYPTIIAIGVNGLPIIRTNFRYYACKDIVCSEILNYESIGCVGDMIIGIDGLPIDVNCCSDDERIEVNHCLDDICEGYESNLIPRLLPWCYGIRMTVGTNGLPVLASIHEDGLYVTSCSDMICSYGTSVLVDGDTETYHSLSITIGVDGLPIISYLGPDWDLKIIHCNNPFCTPYFRRP